MAFLLNPDSYVTSAGMVVSERHRLELLGSLAMTLSRLHVLGVAVGDLSPKNLLSSLAPSPGCFLLDCDAVQLGGETVVKQVETPDWEAPAREPLATTATDGYKFGLLAIRLFARDQSSRDKAPLAAVSPELGRLAGLSQHPSPSQRPQPSAWIAALDIAASTASARAAQPTTSSPRISVPSPPSPLTHPHPPHPASRSAGRVGTRTLAVIAGLAVAVIVVVAGVHAASHPAASVDASSGTSAEAQASQVNDVLSASSSSRRTHARQCGGRSR